MIGRGGMGIVFRAHHRVTGRVVAIKWMQTHDSGMHRRMLREAKAMGKLSHPNVVGVLDVGEHEGSTFLVMEYLEGRNLRNHSDGRQLSPTEAATLLLPALSGVAAAHQAGIQH